MPRHVAKNKQKPPQNKNQTKTKLLCLTPKTYSRGVTLSAPGDCFFDITYDLPGSEGRADTQHPSQFEFSPSNPRAWAQWETVRSKHGYWSVLGLEGEGQTSPGSAAASSPVLSRSKASSSAHRCCPWSARAPEVGGSIPGALDGTARARVPTSEGRPPGRVVDLLSL